MDFSVNFLCASKKPLQYVTFILFHYGKMRETGWEGVDWTHLAQDRDH